MSSGDKIERLQRWYRSNCDGVWEHSYGVRIATLDNPGWRVDVQLTGTPLASVAFAELETHRSEHDWIVCRVVDRVFQGRGGPENLAELLDTFLAWAETAGTRR